jgi:hypothetical protein
LLIIPVTTSKIVDASVTIAKLAAGVIPTSLPQMERQAVI